MGVWRLRIIHTQLFLGFVMQDCTECQQAFRTYVPGVDTVMPDGSSFFTLLHNTCALGAVKVNGGGTGIKTCFLMLLTRTDVMSFRLMLYFKQLHIYILLI